MSSYTNKKKKKEFSFEEWSNANHGISKEQEEEDARKRQAYLASTRNRDIAPVKGTISPSAESALSDPDFRKYSDLGASVENPSFEDATKGIGIAGWRPFADEIQNPVTYVRENEMEVRLLGNKPLDGIDFLWANMTDEEVEVYNYYLAKDGKDKAEKYLKSLERTLSEREGKKISNNINGNSVAEVIIGGLAGVESGVKGATVGMKNLITGSEETIAPSPMQYADRMMAEDNDETFGFVHNAAYGIGNMAPSLAVGILNPIAGAATMGLGVAGNKYDEMIEEGYDPDEARGSGIINGVSEGLTQYLIGGIGKYGGKAASKVFSKIAPKAAGKIAEIIAKVAGKTPRILQAVGHASVEMGKEATEEALQTYLEPLVDSWVTGEEFEAPDFEEVVYSALLGAVTSGILEGAPAVGKATVDTVTGKPKLTADEQTVSDRVAEYEIARREKAGETLTEKEKKKIAEAVQRDMDKGYIPTEAIEAVLGGESYKTYRDTVTREDALRQEYEELGGLEKPTLAQQTRYQELHNSRDTFINDDMRNDLRSKAKDEVRKRVSGTRLEQSYLEAERKNERFTADTAAYKDENARKTVENIVNSGLLDNTNKSHEIVDFLAKTSKDRKVTVEVTNNEKLKAEGKVYTFKKDITADGNTSVFSVGGRNIDKDFKPVVTVDGKAVTDFKVDYAKGEITFASPVAADSVIHVEYQKVAAMNGSYEKGKRVITFNVDSEEAIQTTIGHELKHSFEGTEYEDEFNKAIVDYAKKVGTYDSLVESVKRTYYGADEDTIKSEVTAILTGEYITTDEEFVKHLSTNHRNIFQKIYDEIKHWLKMVTAGSKEARALERAKHIYEKMYRTEVKTDTNASSVSVEDNVGSILSDLTELEAKRADVYNRFMEANKANDTEAVHRLSEELDELDRQISKAEADLDANAKADDGKIQHSIKGEKANLSEEDRINLQNAKRMKEAGKSNEEIYKETGWYTQSDGKWRTEIPDEIMNPMNFSRTGLQSAKDAEADKYLKKAEDGFKNGNISEDDYEDLVEFAEGIRGKSYNSGKLPMFLDAPQLYEAYPQLKNVNLFFKKLSGMQGYTDTGLNQIVLDPDGLHDAGQTVREGLAHEIQHIIQNIEGFTRGSTPERAGGYEAYRKAGGEIESRDVEDRLRMTPEERRANMPVQFSIRLEDPPKETGIAYKVFFVKDGKLYPPMVANPDGADTPMGVWLNADVGTAAPPSKTGRAQVKAGGKGTQGGGGSLAFRPGWHLGDLPRASQFDRVNPETGKKELFPENFVWAEVEYAKDVDYQEEAMSYGYTENGKFRHAYAGLPRLPENGYYRYRTNPKPDTVPWVITGAMKVNRLLSDAEVNEILEANGVPAVHRQGGDVGLDKFGFDESGTVQYSLDKYTQKQYNDFGWARDTEAITKNELDDLYSKAQEKRSLKKFRQSANGEAIIEVNDDPHASLGVNNVFAFVKGTINEPEITRVVRVNAFDEESLDIIRKDIYESTSDRTLETYARRIGEEFLQYYNRNHYANYREYAQRTGAQRSGSESERNTASDRNGYLRRITFGETEANEITSNKETSSDDGVFFDGEKTSLSLSRDVDSVEANPIKGGGTWRTPASSLRYEAPVRDDIAPTPKTEETPSLADIPVLPDEPIAKEEPVKNAPPMPESDEEIIKTVKERLNAKITNSATELEETKLLRDWVRASYENKIDKLQQTLDSKKNKDTKVAVALRKRIANLKRLSADVDADIQKRISDIDSRISKTTERLQDPPKKDLLEVRYERIDKQLEEDKIALKEDFDKRKAALWESTQDKPSYISNKALDLYNEVKSMRKGVRVSGELGYLLDNLDLSEEHKSESYKRLRQALIDIKNRPNQTVNQYSEIESIAREMLNSSYEDAVYDLDDMDNQYQEDVKRLEADAEAQKKAIREQAEALHRADVQRQKLSEVESILNSKGFSLDEMLDNPVRQLSTFETTDTMPQRVMEKTFGYEAGQALADATVNKVAQNESVGLKWLDSITNRKNGLLAQLSKQYNIKPHSKEIAAAMMYGEGSWVNEETGEEFAYGDAELAKDFPDVKVQNNIKALVRDPRIRQFYDETLDAINESRKRNGYPEIPRRANYFLHYRELGDFFTKHGLPFNPNDARAKDLPTDMVGRTADLKPGQPFFTSSWQRKGKKTSYDLFEGMERYANSAKNQIYHIDDIQTLRALHYHLAERFGQAQGLEDLNKLTPEEASEQIKKVYGSHLSTFAAFLDTEANILAGKTSMIDRALSEGMLGRRILTFMDALNQQTGATMVGYNVSSANTNWLPVVREFANSNPVDSVKALAQTVANIASRGKLDSFREDSTVYIRRQGADRFNRKLWQKMQDPAYALMGAVDSISTEIIARTEYNKAIREGMNPQEAHYESDKKVSRLMADRSLGQMPQMYTSRIMGLITKFQLEVRNDMDSMFYDTLQEEKLLRKDIENALERNAKTAAKVAWRYGATAVALHAFGQAFEAVAGYNPAFDIIEAITKAFGWDDDEDDEDTWRDNLGEGAMSLLEDLPYAGIVLDGGRIPISSALPDLKGMIEGKDEYGNEKTLGDSIKEIAPYMLPAGGNQLKKSIQGLKMFSDEHPVTGSYTDSGKLRFPVEDTPLNRVQAAVFGQYASKNAREYFDNDYAPLAEKQIQEYIDVDMPIKDYWEYREGLSDLAPLPGKTSVSLEQKLDYVDGMDLPTRKKNILANNLTERKEPIDMTSYGDYGSLEEFDYATKNPEKYALAKSVGGYSSYKKYSGELYDIKADKDASGKSINGSRKEKVIDYINNLDADYYTKIILYKSEYPSDDTYNYEIVNHINNRSDMSYDERIALLTELGFRVTADGKIYAD